MARPVSFREMVVGDYSSAHIMQLLRSAMQRSKLKKVPFAGLDPLYTTVSSQIRQAGYRCPCCKNEYKRHANGLGGGGSQSLSVHRVIASYGYVPENIVVICQSCNNAIGETNTYKDILARVRALRWQAKIMLKTAKVLMESGRMQGE